MKKNKQVKKSNGIQKKLTTATMKFAPKLVPAEQAIDKVVKLTEEEANLYVSLDKDMVLALTRIQNADLKADKFLRDKTDDINKIVAQYDKLIGDQRAEAKLNQDIAQKTQVAYDEFINRLAKRLGKEPKGIAIDANTRIVRDLPPPPIPEPSGEIS